MSIESWLADIVPASCRSALLTWIESRNRSDAPKLVDDARAIIESFETALSVREGLSDALLLMGLEASDPTALDATLEVTEEGLRLDPFNAEFYITRAAISSIRTDEHSTWKFAALACQLSSNPSVFVAAAELLQYERSVNGKRQFTTTIAVAKDAVHKLVERLNAIQDGEENTLGQENGGRENGTGLISSDGSQPSLD